MEFLKEKYNDDVRDVFYGFCYLNVLFYQQSTLLQKQ